MSLRQEFLRWPVERLAGGAVRLGAGNVYEAGIQKVPSGFTGLLSMITPEFIEYIVKTRRETVRKIGRALRAFRIVAANELNLPAPIVEHIETFMLPPLAESVPCRREEFFEFMCRLRDNYDCECALHNVDRSGVGRGTYRGEEIWRGAYSGKYHTERWKVFPRDSMREELLRMLVRDDENTEDEDDLDDESYGPHSTRNTPEQEQRLQQMPYQDRWKEENHAGFLVVADSDLEDEYEFEGFKKPGWHFMPGIEQHGDFEGYASDKQEPLEYTENVEHLAVRISRNGLLTETSAADSTSSDDEDTGSSEDEDGESQFEPWATVWAKLSREEERRHDAPWPPEAATPEQAAGLLGYRFQYGGQYAQFGPMCV